MKFLSDIPKSKVVILIILAIIIWKNLEFKYWNHEYGVIQYDVISYYSYLPATFIYKDITLEFVDENRHYFSNKIYTGSKEKTGTYVIKTTMGMAYLYAPFFFMADLYTKHFSDFEPSGYTPPYAFFLTFSGVFYFLIGFICMRKLLRRYFDDWLVSLTLIIVVLGTNLYTYCILTPCLPHTYNFALFSIFLLLTDNWHKKQSVRTSVFIGLLGGLIALIRPTNIIVFIVFILWEVNSIATLKSKFILFLKNYKSILVITFCALIVWIPQMIYWKHLTGSLFYYSYPEHERFYFSDPEIIKVLFSYRKGWLLYTPLMAMSVIGLPFLFKYFRKASVAVPVFLVINIYIISSWWDWWYGGSFGMRPMIDSYGLLVLPIISLLEFLKTQKRFVKISLFCILVFLIYLNFFNTWQYKAGIIDYAGMTKKTYRETFLRSKRPDTFYEDLERPDYNALKKNTKDNR